MSKIEVKYLSAEGSHGLNMITQIGRERGEREKQKQREGEGKSQTDITNMEAGT